MKIYHTFIWGVCLAMAVGFSSCEDYLDKEPESTLNSDEAFKNFRNFQGYVEEIYNCIPDKMKCNWCPTWNWGDDEVMNTEGNGKMTHQADLGNFRAWQTTGNWLKNGGNHTGNHGFDHSLWPESWYCIRKANMGIANLDKLTSVTQEQKNLIEGQLYFFRAWWHFELMQFFGGLPYVEEALEGNQEFSLPRLSFQACADKAAADFRHAADLLPVNWDDTTVGKETAGHNDLRINKIMALGYLGKCYLWAASPLMEHGAQIGAATSGKTYEYNEDYCKKAADVFGKLLELVENGQTQYALVGFDYKKIYDHEEAQSSANNYTDIFYTINQGWKMPGATEAIFRPTPFNKVDASNWHTPGHVFGPKNAGLVAGDKIVHQPTANYVDYYGMANGLPLDDPDSKFSKEQPFKDRDPRFYHDIVFDGFKFINGTVNETNNSQYIDLVYCSLYTGGLMRDVALASSTGYFIQKLAPHTCNEVDQTYGYGTGFSACIPYMRLADVYLMYAEACAAVGGATASAATLVPGHTFDKTAKDAVNTIRERCGAGWVADSYAANPHTFMDEIRRERAVELSFEGFRFNDLQRWLLLTEKPYTVKTSHEFTRIENNDFYKNNDPKDARVAGFTEKELRTRVYGIKHYWFPFPDSDVYLYPEFAQNPGW